MNDQIVTFEVAKLAKDHGFNIPTSQFYNDDGTLNGCISLKDSCPFGIYAPSQTCICRWLRKEKNIHIVPYPIFLIDGVDYRFDIYTPRLNKPKKMGYYSDYEDGIESSLKYIFKNLL